MYYIYLKALIRVMDKKISARTREYIAKGLCAGCVIVCLAVSLLAQDAGLHVEETKVVTIESNYNLLSAGHNQAVIQLTKSELPQTAAMRDAAHPSNRNVVKRNGEDASENEANLVAENPKALSLVQGVKADNGLQPETFECKTRYQYPVEPGYPAEQNYDGRQDAGDFILCDTFRTISEEEQDFEEPEDADLSVEDMEPADEEAEDAGTSAEDKEQTDEPEEERNEGAAISGNQIDEPENQKEGDSAVSANQIEEPQEIGIEGPQPPIQAERSFFTINGTLNKEGTIFTSDIRIEPTGAGNYRQIRLGDTGVFGNSLLITKDAIEETLQLYLSDGETVSNAVDFTYSKDTAAPVLGVDKNRFHLLEAERKDIYCTNDFRLSVSCNDLETGSGIEQLSYVYGDKTNILFDHLEEPVLSLTDDFYGKVVMNCTDRAGNPSETAEIYFLVEDDAPKVSIFKGELCTAPYTAWIDIFDDGNIVSGIESMKCTVNGEEFTIENPLVCETTELYQDLTVVSGYKFPIVLQEVGTYDISVTAADNAGNVTEYETQVEVQEPQLVSILMLDSFAIHIDPQGLLGKEQIFSDELVLENMSDFDVRVNIDSVDLKVQDGVSDQGIQKDCTIYLTAPDTGEKLALQKGINEEVYSYRLPKGAEGDIRQLFFSGNVTEGSDEMWKDSDISINVRLSFEKWEESD